MEHPKRPPRQSDPAARAGPEGVVPVDAHYKEGLTQIGKVQMQDIWAS